jgi:hypothetical protein
MVQYVEMKDIFNGALNILNPGIAEFHHFVALGADQVIVLPSAIRFFVLRKIFTELVFAHQVTFNQQIEGVVNCRPAHAIILILHADIQGLNIEVSVT